MKTKINSFTQAELQYMQSMFAEVLNVINHDVLDIKYNIETIWGDCNPDDPTSQYAFNFLNRNKRYLKQNRKDHKVLAEIQRKIKRLAGN